MCSLTVFLSLSFSNLCCYRNTIIIQTITNENICRIIYFLNLVYLIFKIYFYSLHVCMYVQHQCMLTQEEGAISLATVVTDS